MDNTLSPIVVYPTGEEPVEKDNATSLGTPTENTNETSIGTPLPIGPSLPDNVATVRATKIQQALPQLSKTADEIKVDIQNGRENALRAQAASDFNVQNQRAKLQQLQDLANQKGGPLDENEVARIMDPFNPMNKPVDPDSVVERNYALVHMGGLDNAMQAVKDTPVEQAKQEIPEQVQPVFDKGDILATKMEFARKIREDLEAQIHSQSWPGFLADQAKTMFQPYNEYTLRGNVPDVGGLSGGLLLGTNLEEQADHIFNLPLDQFTKTLRNITTEMAKGNPTQALRLARYVEGLPATDRILDNTFSLLAPADYAAIGKVGLGVTRKISLYNRTNIAVKQLVKVGADVEANTALRAEASGDLSTAAEGRSTNLILKDLDKNSDPIQTTKEPLLTMLDQDKTNLTKDVGNLSTEQVRRIQDGYDAAGKTLLQRIVDAARINRTPMPLAVNNAVKVLKNAVTEYYPGIRNAILDVSNPLYEARSNTYWHEITLGNFDGTLFGNPETAQNFANLHGLNADVIQSEGTITRADVQKLLNKQTTLKKQLSDAEDAIRANEARAQDTNLSEAEIRKAREQIEGLSDFKKKYEKDINETELRLKNNETYDRVSNLQSQADLAKAYNKDARKKLVRGTMTGEDRQILRDAVAANDSRISGYQQEIKALKEGKAEVVGSHRDTIEQHGVGYKLVIRRPLVETDHAVRDLMIRDVNKNLIPEAVSTSSQGGLKSMFNQAIGKWRGADDTLSLNESINRKIGTYTQSIFKEWANQEAKYLRAISTGVIREDPVTGETIPYFKAKISAVGRTITGNVKKGYNEFVRTLEHARDAKDPDTGKPGYFFQNPGELNNHYLTYFQRSPTYAEHQAYFAFVRMVEGDRIWREVSEFRNRARQGYEQFSLGARGNKNVLMKSDYFDAKALKVFPGGDDVMMIMSRRLGDEKIVNLGGAGISPRDLEMYREGVKTGKYKAMEIYAPEYKPLRNFSDKAGNEHVRYVLTETADSKPLEFNHVNRRGGGHFEYDYEHFLKQANMYHQYENLNGVKGRYRSVYTGDTTFMPLLNRVMGRDIAGKLHEVQRLLREGDIEGAKRWSQAHLPIDWDKLHSMFLPGRDELGKVTSPQLDLHEPFVVVPNGRTILDMDKSLEMRNGGPNVFKDATRSGSANKMNQVAYNTERESFGINHLEDIGTQGNPIYKYAPTAKMIDPIATMNKALNRIINTTFMDDYKIYAVEHWLREAEDHLEPIRGQLARSSPNWVFASSESKTAFRAGTPDAVVSNLLSNRYKIKQFLGVPSTAQTAIHSAKEWLLDTAYERYGPEANRSLAQKALTIVPNWMLDHVTDPVVFLRSMAFHEKLGLFNPAQLLVQAQTHATIMALSPVHGTTGMYAATLHQWSRLNRSPEMIAAMDRYATKLNLFGYSNWKPGEFTEAMKALESTGFEKVAGEHSNLNTALKTDFVGNSFKSFLNAGTFFFTEGEKSTRLSAWYTAFREFREANPTGPVTRSDIGKILQRADLLTVNMSRASNSALNSGVFSLTTQFQNYTIRQAELFMGGRTTAMEKFRLFTFYAALYGAPSAVGLSGLPLQNAIRTEAMQRGYNVGENWLSTAVDLGLPTIGAAWVTGGGDWNKGNLYNLSSRYGSPGLQSFNDALRSDHAWWKLLGGASGSILMNQLTAGSNFWKSMAYQAFGDNKERAFPLLGSHFMDLFNEIPIVDQPRRFLAAVNTGKWFSKNEAYIGDVTKSNAAFMAIMGINPQSSEDAFVESGIRSAQVEYQKSALKDFIKEQRRGYDNQSQGNYAEAKQNFAFARAMLEQAGYPTDKIATAYSLALKGYESRIKEEDYNMAFKDVPQSRSDFMGIPTPFTTQTNIPEVRREQYRRKLQTDQLRGQ